MSADTSLLPSNDRIEEVLLDRPIASLTDIAYIYGGLDQIYAEHRYDKTLGNEGETTAFESAPFVRTPPSSDHFRLMTPDDKRQLFNDEDALVSINVVLDPETETARLVDVDGGDQDGRGRPISLVSTERLTWERMVDIGYLVRPDKRGDVRDHSIPTSVNGKNPQGTAQYARERINQWTDDIALRVAEDHADGWIVRALDTLGNDDHAIKASEDAVEAMIKGLDSIRTNYKGLASLRFWVPKSDKRGAVSTDSDTGLLGPIYPGMLPVANDVAAAKLDEQMKSFSAADNSTGTAADYVSGTVATVLGTSPGRPADYYKAKQEGVFADFDADRSWQNYPLDPETATIVARGSQIIARCRQRIGPDTFARFLPYVGASVDGGGMSRERPMDATDARVVYGMLDRVFRGHQGEEKWETESIADVLAGEVGGKSAPDGLQYYLIIVNESGKKDKILDEQSGCSVLPLRRLSDAHASVLASSWVRDRDDAPTGPIVVYPYFTGNEDDDSDKDWFFDREQGQIGSVLSGWYLRQTMDDPERHQDSAHIDPADARIEALTEILAGEPIEHKMLLGSYVDRVRRDQRGMFGDSSIEATIPKKTIAKQLIQYNALARGGLLNETAVRHGLPIASEHDYYTTMPDDTTTTTEEPNNRDERLRAYIKDHRTLREDPERRASFLLGAFAARVAASQLNEGVAGTITRRYSIDKIRQRELLRAYSEISTTNEQYAASNDSTGMNSRYQRAFGDIINDHPPEDWSLTDTEIRAYYAAGLAYGRDDTSMNDDEEAESEVESGQQLTVTETGQ